MSTRALIVLLERDKDHPTEPPFKETAVIYKHYDGYPDGLGVRLASFLTSVELVNGIPLSLKHDPPNTRICNGAGDMWAQLILALKEDIPGDVYLHPAGTRGRWADYVYWVLAGAEKELPAGAHTFRRELTPTEVWMTADSYDDEARGITRCEPTAFMQAVLMYNEDDDD